MEQGALGTSYGGWLADEVQRRFFDWLDQPVARVTGGEASPSISKVLERAAIAKAEEVAAGLERVRAGFGLPVERLMATVVVMPSVVAGATEAVIARWLVAPGDVVAAGIPLAEIETEKALVEYQAEPPASSAASAAEGEAGEGRADPILAGSSAARPAWTPAPRSAAAECPRTAAGS